MKKLFLWFPVLIFVIMDIMLSLMSWEEIRSNLEFIKEIPQTTSFKLRHIIQFAPQSAYLTYLLHKYHHFNINKTLVIVSLSFSFIAISSEVIQLFQPSRIFSLFDILWNLIAASIGIILYFGIEKFISRKA